MVEGAAAGVALLLTGRAEDLRTELAQAELIYTRSPGYDGTDAFQVLLYILCGCFMSTAGVGFSRPLGTK